MRLPEEALEGRAQSCPHRPPAAVENPERRVEKTIAPRPGTESEPPTPSLAPTLAGNFVSAHYESDCARFVSEAKRLARRRAEAALERPSLGY
jgi:hypothetical protein